MSFMTACDKPHRQIAHEPPVAIRADYDSLDAMAGSVATSIVSANHLFWMVSMTPSFLRVDSADVMLFFQRS